MLWIHEDFSDNFSARFNEFFADISCRFNIKKIKYNGKMHSLPSFIDAANINNIFDLMIALKIRPVEYGSTLDCYPEFITKYIRRRDNIPIQLDDFKTVQRSSRAELNKILRAEYDTRPVDIVRCIVEIARQAQLQSVDSDYVYSVMLQQFGDMPAYVVPYIMSHVNMILQTVPASFIPLDDNLVAKLKQACIDDTMYIGYNTITPANLWYCSSDVHKILHTTTEYTDVMQFLRYCTDTTNTLILFFVPNYEYRHSNLACFKTTHATSGYTDVLNKQWYASIRKDGFEPVSAAFVLNKTHEQLAEIARVVKYQTLLSYYTPNEYIKPLDIITITGVNLADNSTTVLFNTQDMSYIANFTHALDNIIVGKLINCTDIRVE